MWEAAKACPTALPSPLPPQMLSLEPTSTTPACLALTHQPSKSPSSPVSGERGRSGNGALQMDDSTRQDTTRQDTTRLDDPSNASTLDLSTLDLSTLDHHPTPSMVHDARPDVTYAHHRQIDGIGTDMDRATTFSHRACPVGMPHFTHLSSDFTQTCPSAQPLPDANSSDDEAMDEAMDAGHTTGAMLPDWAAGSIPRMDTSHAMQTRLHPMCLQTQLHGMSRHVHHMSLVLSSLVLR